MKKICDNLIEQQKHDKRVNREILRKQKQNMISDYDFLMGK